MTNRRLLNATVLLVALSFAACSKNADPDEEKKTATVPDVTVTKVERGELQQDPRHITELRLN